MALLPRPIGGGLWSDAGSCAYSPEGHPLIPAFSLRRCVAAHCLGWRTGRAKHGARWRNRTSGHTSGIFSAAPARWRAEAVSWRFLAHIACLCRARPGLRHRLRRGLRRIRKRRNTRSATPAATARTNLSRSSLLGTEKGPKRRLSHTDRNRMNSGTLRESTNRLQAPIFQPGQDDHAHIEGRQR